ncbi:hypothetical protein [Roseofilum capinflatum]|uniref:Glycosyl transferase family 8 n=1 Tax=Roseofilum capinflatum BLCC-M114 TaxID=3022440 RepID=A0ABT7B8A2_9CYAN|nr:hypothetical protein [Roseofilum capinflatum]MDJ1175404.1 hypothetical protein [Roseofilum capinflatum BLCC-M114]
MKKVIVTLAIGQSYLERWYRLCYTNWQRYAELQGYDLICINSPLDKYSRGKSRSPCWQKCLILGDKRVKKYDRVVWLDSDILINPNSPCIVEGVPEEKVGAVEMFSSLSEYFPGSEPGKIEILQDRAIEFWGWKNTFRSSQEFYAISGLPDQFDKMIQSGVMVLSPQHHQSILEEAYYHHEDSVEHGGEMQHLSYEIVKNNCVHWLDYRFNRLWSECLLKDYPFLLPAEAPDNKVIRAWKRFTRGTSILPPKKMAIVCLASAFINNYFLHFAGTSEYMPWLNTKILSWSQLRNYRL